MRALYRLTAGRLAEVEPLAQGGGRLLAVHRPGALLGGAELLGARRHATTVTALRDSELQAIDADRAGALLRDQPGFLAEVARAALAPMGAPVGAERRKSSILGLVGAADSVDVRDLAERLAVQMRALGADVAVMGAETSAGSPAALSGLEIENDFVLIAADRGQGAFIDWCVRQIDRLVIVAAADTPPPHAPFASAPIRKQRLIDIVLVQPPGVRRPLDSDPWLDIVPASRLFHVRRGSADDVARLARIYTGNSVGLVLSGGAARAYAHVGVVRALAELNVPIDFLAGTSMGAVVAAGVAMGWGIEEMDQRIRQAFVETSPLSDIAFPLLAMTGGRRVDRRLETHFQDVEISDLWRPFACVSTDLTMGAAHIHRRGAVRHALRASLSLPGVLPPVVERGHVLVDGALVNNLPTDLARQWHDGVTIGVDVAVTSHGLSPDDLRLRPSGLAWLTSGAWRRGPPIVSVLMRSATVPSLGAQPPPDDDRDLTLLPRVATVGLQDWRAYDHAVAAGYEAAMEAADRLEPLRRPSVF